MLSKPKPSTASRTSIRGLIIACLPAAALGAIANSPVLDAVFTAPTNAEPAIEDNTSASTNGAKPQLPGINSGQIFTNEFEVVAGKRG